MVMTSIVEYSLDDQFKWDHIDNVGCGQVLFIWQHIVNCGQVLFISHHIVNCGQVLFMWDHIVNCGQDC